MKKLLIALILCAVALMPLSGALAADQIILGTLPVPQGEILELIKPAFQESGDTLIVAPFPDESMLNEVLLEGSIHANFYQNQLAIEAHNAVAADDKQIAAAIPVYFVPYSIYRGSAESIEALQDGAAVGIPSDESELSRALRLLNDAGLIALTDGHAEDASLTLDDISDNPKGLVFTQADQKTLIESLDRYAIAVIDGNAAEEMGLKGERALISEGAQSLAAKEHAVYIAVRLSDVEKDWVKTLENALYTDLIHDYLVARGYAPVFTLEDMEPEG